MSFKILTSTKVTPYTNFVIPKSVYLEKTENQRLQRTPSVEGNRKTLTFNTWFKRNKIGIGNAGLLSTFVTTPFFMVRFDADDTLSIFEYDTNYMWRYQTVKKFQDTTAWYNLNLSIDTTQAVSTDRVKLEINGETITSFSTSTAPSQNSDLYLNLNRQHLLGAATTSIAYDGYLANTYFIDGQALDSSNFGEVGDNGIWIAKSYVGTYGTNGFFLEYGNASDFGEATVGDNWTVNGVMSTENSVTDSPTMNYCTINILDNGGQTIAHGGLKIYGVNAWDTARSTFSVDSGKWYWEGKWTGATTNFVRFGIANVSVNKNNYCGSDANGWSFIGTGNKVTNGSSVAYGSAISSNDTLMCALDMDSGKVWWGKNGTWFESGNPASGTGEAYSGLSGFISPAITEYTTADYVRLNFGQSGFTYTPPTGFNALSVTNILETDPIETSGSFVGNALAEGPYVYVNGILDTLSINGNAVTWGTHAIKTANGFKVITTSSSYNSTGTNTWTATATTTKFKYANAV